MQAQQLQRKSEPVDIMESQIYGHRTIVPSDYRDMLKFAEVMYQTSGEILEHIKNEAKKKFNDQNKNWR